MSRSAAAVFLLFVIFLVSPPPGAFSAENITGIWIGEYDSGKHLKIKTDIASQARSSGSGSDQGNYPGLFGSKEPGQNGHVIKMPLRMKIYYENNTVHVEDLLSDRSGGIMNMISAPQNFTPMFQRATASNITKQTYPLQEHGVMIVREDNRHLPNGAGKIQVKSTVELKRQLDSDMLIIETKNDCFIEQRPVQGRAVKSHIITTTSIPLKRDKSDPNIWSDDEITHLLEGAEKHPIVILPAPAPPPKLGTTALSSVIEHILGRNKQGLERIFVYGTELYNFSPHEPFEIDMNTQEHGYYNYFWDTMGLAGKLGIGVKAFRYNILFLLSCYVHEYTHFLQHTKSEQSLDKIKREAEANCSQIRYIQNHKPLPGPLEHTKDFLVKYVTDNHNQLFSQHPPLNCTTMNLPRDHILAEVDALGGTSRAMRSEPEAIPRDSFIKLPASEGVRKDRPLGNEWKVIVQ